MEQPVDAFNTELHKLMAHRDKMSADLNSTERHLAGQLILLTTVLISAAIIILGFIAEKSIHLTLATRILLVIGFVLLIMSVFAGIANYFEIMKHFKQWIRIKDELARKISFDEYNDLNELRRDMATKQSAVPYESGRFFSYFQIGTLISAFLIYLALVIIFVFSSK